MGAKLKRKVLYLHERDGYLFVRVPYRDSNGVRKSKERRVQNESEAVRVIAELMHQLGEAGPAIFDGEKMTFDELIAEYKKAFPKKPDWYLDPIEKYFKGRKIRSITHGDCVRFKTSREQIKDQRYRHRKAPARKPATIHRELEALRSVLLFALDHGWLLRNPFKARQGSQPLIIKAAEDRRDQILTPGEEEKLLAACGPPREHLRGLVLASLDTGLRRGALFSLTWACVDFQNNFLRVPSGNRYKKRPKIIGLTARLRDELAGLFVKVDKQAARAASFNVPIFKAVDFKRSWKTACKIAGVEGLRFNDLRHGFATDMMEAGVPQHLAMKAAGHSNAEIHDIYTNVDERLAKQIAAALDQLHRSRRKPGTAPSSEPDPNATVTENQFIN